MSRLNHRAALSLIRSTVEYGQTTDLQNISNVVDRAVGLAGLGGILPTFRRPIVATTTDVETVQDLRFRFSIERTIHKEPNDCKVTVFNMAERSRAYIQKRPLRVLLDVAWEGATPQRLFDGDLRWSESLLRQDTWETELELGDGERAFRYARANASFRAGTPVHDAVAKTIGFMGMKVPTNLASFSELTQRKFASGVTLSGRAHFELTRLLDPLHIIWNIQDGLIYLFRKDEPRQRSEPDLIVSEQEGMMGSPEYGAPPPDGKRPVLHVKTQLDARYVPGKAIRVEARAFSKGANRFRLSRVRHEGDTWNGPWETQLEAEPL
jgi:hypothetical protein